MITRELSDYIAQKSGADPDKLFDDLQTYGLRNFLASIELTSYSDETKKILKDVNYLYYLLRTDIEKQIMEDDENVT